jgi:hypothetical protein
MSDENVINAANVAAADPSYQARKAAYIAAKNASVNVRLSPKVVQVDSEMQKLDAIAESDAKVQAEALVANIFIQGESSQGHRTKHLKLTLSNIRILTGPENGRTGDQTDWPSTLSARLAYLRDQG